MNGDYPKLDSVKLLSALCERVIGPDGLRVAYSHFADGVAVRQLAEWHGVPRSTLNRKLNELLVLLAQHDAVPSAWHRQTNSRGAITTHNTECRDFYLSHEVGHNPPTW